MMAEKKETKKSTAKPKKAASKQASTKAQDAGAPSDTSGAAEQVAQGKAGAKKVVRRGHASQGPLRFSVCLRHVRISPRKARMVVNLIKGRQVAQALQILDNSAKKGASFSSKLLRAAIANAKERAAVDVDSLWVVGGFVDMGRTLKRYMPGAQGRANPIRKRSSHITIQVGEVR